MKKPDLPYLVRQRSKGRDYWYFRRGGESIRLPDPSDANFLRAYDEAKRGRTRKPVKRNFRALITAYKSFHKYKSLAPRTKVDYSKVMDYLLDIVGEDDPAKMIKRDVVEAQMANLHRKRFANEVPAMLSRLFEHGITIGWLDKNPAKGVEKIKTGDGHKPWPDALVEAYTEAATGVDRMPEKETPATCYWNGRWWMRPEGIWENYAVGWTDFPPTHPHTDKPQERRPHTKQAD